MAATREVTGVDLTLREAIEQNVVPTPGLVDWNDWQRWRRDVGMRPTYPDDGVMLDNRVEATLWRETMEHLYGAQWLEDLSTGPAALRAEAPGPAASADLGADGSQVQPPAERPAAEDIAFLRAAAAAASPGSGEAQDQARPAQSPGSGERTPRNTPSWHSTSPGSPATLLKTVMQNYNARKEPIDTYISRLTRQATAPETLEHPSGQESSRL